MKGVRMNNRFGVVIAIAFLGTVAALFQNCSDSVDFSGAPAETSSSSTATPSPTPTPTPVPTPTPTPTVQCSAAQHRVLGTGGTCICDFANGYYEVAGQCQLTTAVPDVCSPKPASCAGVSVPSPVYRFDMNTASLTASQLVLGSTSNRMNLIGSSSLMNQAGLISENVCGTNRKVFKFPSGIGLKQSTSSPIPSNYYSVSVLLRFNYSSATCQRTWARIFDNKNNTIDQGLYMYGDSSARNLQFYNFSSGTARSTSNQYAWITFTKNGSNISGYFNRQLQWQYSDISGWSNLNTLKDMIYFKDDTAVPNEECEGATAMILVFNQALSKQQAECLTF